MYRTDLNSGHKSSAMIAVAAVHAALFFVFLNISGTIQVPGTQEALRVFDITDPPPPPPPPPPQAKQEKAREPEGGSSPNRKSEATPVAAPKPRIVLPVPPKIVVAEVPHQGAAPTQGAAPVAGPGIGAGGSGTGTGSGSGAGGGGGSGYVVPPRLVTPDLRGRDFPQAMLRAWPRGVPIFARIRVGAEGSVVQCIVDRGTGNPAIDSQVCATVKARLRYSPARSASGQPVAGWSGYVQEPPR